MVLWGSDYLGNSNIVDANVYCLRTKFERDGLPRLIQTVRGVGYTLRTAA
jgi:DNA-binding response OmpR family regulator